MSALGSLVVKLALDYAAFTGGLQQGEQAALSTAKKVQDTLDGMQEKFSDVAKTVAGSLAAAFTVDALAGWVKGAIDAADAAGKLAEKTGIAVEQLAGLQLAFEGAGVGQKLEATLSKLVAEASNGNQAFAAMGVSVNNSNGQLKNARDLLGEVSDKFASYQDGAAKSALAQKIFGESGAEMIILLNGGSEALAEADEAAAALGLTLSEETANAAGQFNDTLDLAGQIVSGMATKVAAELLPTLNTLAGELMTNVTNSGILTGTSNALSVSFKGLYSVGVGVVQVFSTMGKYLGGVGAAIGALVRGDFGQINGIMADMRADISAGWADAGASIQRTWSDTSNATVTAMAAMATQSKKTAPAIADLAKATKKLADEEKKEAEAKQARIAAGQSANTTWDEEFKAIEKAREATEGRIKSGRELLESIERETAMLGLSNEDREQAIALFALEKAGVVAGTEAYAAYAEKIREAVSARSNKQANLDAIEADKKLTEQAAKDAAAEWQKTADSINSSLTDALMRGFESGKDFGKNLKDTLVNMFKTLILRPTISAILAPVAGGLSGVANAGGVGGGGGGAGNALSMLGNLGSLAGAFGTGMAASFTSMMSAGIGGWASAAGSLIGSGASAGIAAGIGMIAAPLAVAAVLWKPLFGRKLKDSGIEGSFGGERGFEGNSFEFYKGGLLRSNKTKTNPLDEEMRRALGDTFTAMRAQVGTFATALGLDAERIAGFTSSIKVSTKGLSAEDANKKIQEALATANNALAEQVLGTFTSVSEQITKTIQTSGWSEGFDASFETINETVTKTSYTASAFARDGEKAIDTLTRLSSSLLIVNGAWDTLGYTALSASLDSGNLASQLADAFGSLENLGTATASYFENFYTAEERRATMQRQLGEALGKVGVALPSIDAPDARALYRNQVDAAAQNLGTEAGRQTYATLVQLSSAFASITQDASAASAALSGMQAETQKLEIELLKAQGQTEAAATAQRALDTAGYDAATLAAYDLNAALRSQIDATNATSSAHATFTDRFTSDADKLAAKSTTVAAAFASVGLEMPKTKAGFVELVAVTTGPALSAILGVSGAFADMADAADASAASLASTNRGIQDQIDVLAGKETERSLAIRDAVDPTTKVLLGSLHAAQDLAEAADIAPVVDQAASSLNNLGNTLGRFGESLMLRADAFELQTGRSVGAKMVYAPSLATQATDFSDGYATAKTRKQSEWLRDQAADTQAGDATNRASLEMQKSNWRIPVSSAVLAAFEQQINEYVAQNSKGIFTVGAGVFKAFFTDLGGFAAQLETDLATANDTAIGSALNLVSISKYFADLATEMVDIQTELGKAAALAGGGLSLDAVTTGFADTIGTAATGISAAITASLLDKVPEAIRNDPALAGVSTAVLGIVGAVKKDDVQGLNDSFLLLSGALTRGDLTALQYTTAIDYVTGAFNGAGEAVSSTAATLDDVKKRLAAVQTDIARIGFTSFQLALAEIQDRADEAAKAFGSMAPEIVALAEAERTLLGARNAITAGNTIEGLQTEIDRINFTPLQKELAGIDDQQAGYIASLADIGQATGGNVAVVNAWADAMRLAAQKAAAGADTVDALDFAGATDKAYAALERAVGAQRDTLNTQLSAAQDLASEVGGIFSTLKSAVADLYQSVDSTAQQSAAQARAFITGSLAGARATGSLPDGQALSDAVSAARAGMDGAAYGSQFEADRERLVLAGELDQLKEISGNQLTEAERQIEQLTVQIDSLDKILKTEREQIDVMRGIDTSILTVGESLLALRAASALEAAHLASALYSLPMSIASAIASALDSAKTQPDKLPGFASGGSHSGGLRMVGERGWEIEATGPSRIWNQQQLGAALGGGGNQGNAELVAELRELRREVANLRAEVNDGNKNTKQLADQFDQVSAGGNALATEVMA